MSNIQLIKTRVNENNDIVLSGRDLHDFLEVKSNYTTWFERMSEYGFEENTDYIEFWSDSKNGNAVIFDGNKNSMSAKGFILNHSIKLDMAKEIAMIQRSEKGKQARKYFLDVEKAWNSPEKVMERALHFAKLRVEEMERLIFEQKPKVFFADAVGEAENTISVNNLAKLISQNGLSIGEKKLFKWLRDNGYLISRSGMDYNTPMQRYIEQGLFRVKEGVILTNGGSKVSKTTKVTGKGQQYFINKILKGVMIGE